MPEQDARLRQPDLIGGFAEFREQPLSFHHLTRLASLRLLASFDHAVTERHLNDLAELSGDHDGEVQLAFGRDLVGANRAETDGDLARPQIEALDLERQVVQRRRLAGGEQPLVDEVGAGDVDAGPRS